MCNIAELILGSSSYIMYSIVYLQCLCENLYLPSQSSILTTHIVQAMAMTPTNIHN